MTIRPRVAGLGLWALATALGLGGSSACRAQVAFQPVVSSFPNGVGLGVTPVVSADRRYVRMGVDPVFTGLQGFDSFSVPAAVSGGGGGGIPAGLNGVGGFGGGMPTPAGFAGTFTFGNGYVAESSPEAVSLLSGNVPLMPRPSLAAMSQDAFPPEVSGRVSQGKPTAKAKARARRTVRAKKAR